MENTLNLETLLELKRKFLPAPPAIKIIEVEPLPIYKQARTHRKSRINKKWKKRYGIVLSGWDFYLGDNIIVDETSGNSYCHPEIAKRLRLSINPLDISIPVL